MIDFYSTSILHVVGISHINFSSNFSYDYKWGHNDCIIYCRVAVFLRSICKYMINDLSMKP